MYKNILYALLSLLLFSACKQAPMEADIASPNGDLKVHFLSTRDGSPAYQVIRKGEIVVDTSFLGFAFKGMDPMMNRMLIIGTETKTIDETWEQPWGEKQQIRNKTITGGTG